MRRFIRAVGITAAALALGAALASASAPDTNPSARCGDDDVYVRTIQWRGQTIHRELPMATHGGCASSWATDAMSVAAVVGQCRALEEGVILNGRPFVLTYPHTFYGLWRADNRAGCVRILHGLATGELDATVPAVSRLIRRSTGGQQRREEWSWRSWRRPRSPGWLPRRQRRRSCRRIPRARARCSPRSTRTPTAS